MTFLQWKPSLSTKLKTGLVEFQISQFHGSERYFKKTICELMSNRASDVETL